MAAYRTVSMEGLDLFYREAGPAEAPCLVLLPGFPSSSAQYQGLIDRLDGQLHLISPDYPGFGYSSTPATTEFAYTFDHLAELTERLLLEHLGLESFWLYVFLVAPSLTTPDSHKLRRALPSSPLGTTWAANKRLTRSCSKPSKRAPGLSSQQRTLSGVATRATSPTRTITFGRSCGTRSSKWRTDTPWATGRSCRPKRWS